VLGTLLVAAAVLTVAVVLRTADREARAAVPEGAGLAGPAVTPLWSARRVPQVITLGAARLRFASVIAGFAAPGRCVAVDGPPGSLARVAATSPIAPASTEKLLTGAAALHVLGPGNAFTTRVAATATAVGGVVHGDVFLVGGGDPVLATPSYRARLAANPVTASEPTTALADLAGALADAGVHRIDGAIVADDSRYDTLRYLPSLKPSERSDIGPLGALTVDDGIGPSGVATDDPALLTARALAGLLTERGISVAGSSRRGTAPVGATTLASVRSPRLDAIVASMLTVSDNYTAELLVRAVGLSVARVGSTAAGLPAVIATLARLGVPTAGVSLVDGSGLSPENRVTCAALLAAVALGDRPGTRALRVGLAVAGRTGTLAQRFIGDPLAGRLRAKTGRINGVVGLAGIVPTSAGQLRFAFVANGDFSVAGGEALQDQIAHLVASYPVVPQAGRLVPAPAA
jgi:D-alanyl-D-alanine carboxypeptidase/D-alanyl-D-alanine-endopeptidase (penicillin-binding protein 4)